ncbi:uncharacterized protein A4U43_C09F1170 [Asparagus officinalis]|uniref:Late embryogenesis abundant protein LEA-2 subgroup domain-containing protein n=1 Tax=Asparagus officinalis TaxID=4686 RepID=A0A5P1E687_ASPOF|nr:NDR1/HIN1-like protein 3 [Asparagus officinalis]ONK57503.1 uncharacterized protein A4U43_C09F1170 [Asparagus officinalis]
MASNSSNGCLWNLCLSLFKLIVSLGITIFIFWLIFRPSKPKAFIESARLAQFNLTNVHKPNASLTYNLTLNLSVHNPNKRISFYYDYIEAQAQYDGTQFGLDSNFPAFFQHHKDTTVLYPKFMGRAVGLGSVVSTTFEREKREGFFYVDLMVYCKVRIKVMFFKFGHFKPKFGCRLKLAEKPDGGFERTKCDVDF